MAFLATPASWLGPSYSVASNGIVIKTATLAATATGTTVASVHTTTGVFTCAGAHGLSVGDIITFSTIVDIVGVVVSTNYYVLTTPLSTTFTCAAAFNGSTIICSATGTADLNYKGRLAEVTDAEATAATGDIRKVIYGLMEMLYKAWTAHATADRPAKVTLSRSSSVNSTTGEITYTYSVVCKCLASAQEVSDE